MVERSEIAETEELARRLCIENFIETREWVISNEPQRLESLRDIDSKPVLLELKEYYTKYDFVADPPRATHYTGPK